MEVLYGNSVRIINMPDKQFINLFFIDILVDGEKISLVFDTGASITAISEKVRGLLAADIIENYKCVIDFTNNNFKLL